MFIATLCALSLAQTPKIEAATPIDPNTYRVEVVTSDLQTPWNMSWLPNGDMLITERGGTLRILRDDVLLDAPVMGVPEVYARGQAGLFEVELHPDFANNNLVYLTYAVGTSKANTLRLARATFASTDAGGKLENLEVLFTANAERNSAHHYGGRMVWLDDGTLLLTSGEGSRPQFRVRAQSLESHFGKILRLTEDGTPAPGNPFIGQSGALPEIWSYGHRNPQGIVKAPDGTIYANEHGPRGGDEMNVVSPGLNYGWPVITYGIDYSGAQISPFKERQGMEQPLFYWTPSIAPSALLYYDGEAFAQWQGKLFTAALSFKRIQIADPKDPSAPQYMILNERGKRIRDIALGPDGVLYVATEGGRNTQEGEILRILPQQ